jgi:nucleoside-diphosphate-sugar epimerase
MAMRIALTGAAGKLGQAILPQALAAGHEVVAIDRHFAQPLPAAVEGLEIDMGDFSGLCRAFAGCDALIHMAAIPSPKLIDEREVHNNNVVGSYNAMTAAINVGIRRICQGSSVNAIGLAYARSPRFDYFPIDEQHPNYADEGYSLSKWICEQQADGLARRHGNLSIASLRFHWVVGERAQAASVQTLDSDKGRKELWGYVLAKDAARACLLSLEADFAGHEVFYIAASDTTVDEPTAEVAARFYPKVEWLKEGSGRRSFFCSDKARRLLGWFDQP